MEDGVKDLMAKGDDIAARLVAFAVAVLDLCDKLPRLHKGLTSRDNFYGLGHPGRPTTERHGPRRA
jgi:hypothetical protein